MAYFHATTTKHDNGHGQKKWNGKSPLRGFGRHGPRGGVLEFVHDERPGEAGWPRCQREALPGGRQQRPVTFSILRNIHIYTRPPSQRVRDDIAVQCQQQQHHQVYVRAPPDCILTRTLSTGRETSWITNSTRNLTIIFNPHRHLSTLEHTLQQVQVTTLVFQGPGKIRDRKKRITPVIKSVLLRILRILLQSKHMSEV